MLTYKRYAEFRDAANMTDYKMSLLTGVARSTFSRWKADGVCPKIETVMRIAKVLKIPPRELLSREDIKAIKLPGDTDA